MKTQHVFALCTLSLCTLSCERNSELVSPGASDEIALMRSSAPDYPALDPAFSRGLGINNASALVGSTLNSDGMVVAFKLTKNQLWLSDEEVFPNGMPEVRFTINDRGDIVGHKKVTGGIAPVVWKDGLAYDLSPLSGYDYAEVFGINNCGELAGESLNGNWLAPSQMRATVFYEDGSATDLGTLGGNNAAAVDINDQGHITGVAQKADGQSRAFLYKDGVMHDLGTLGGSTSNANGINNKDEVAGRAFTETGAIRGFLYSQGQMINLGTLGGASSVAFDVNDRSEVVGFSRIPNGQARAFLWKDGVMQDLGALGGIDSRAISINNKGEVIGYYTLPDNSVHAFLYKDGQMYPL